MKSKPPIKQKYIESPEELWRLFEEYIDTLEVILVPTPHVKQGMIEIPFKEPMTMEGFKTFGHTKGVTIDHYVKNSNGAYESYCPIVTRIKDLIFKNNFSRAAVGMYKESLISKQLGLTEKQEQTINVEQPLFGEVKKKEIE